MMTRLLTLAAVLTLVVGAVFLAASRSTNDAADAGSPAATRFTPLRMAESCVSLSTCP